MYSIELERPLMVRQHHRGLTRNIRYDRMEGFMEPTNFRTPSRWNSVPVPERVAIRAVEHVVKQDDGCWISQYSTASHGYSQIGWQTGGKRHVVLGHRAAWVFAHGQVPLGMTIDHTCKQRRCVNPEHLRLLPNYENARRTSGRDWPLGFCANGHPNSELVDIGKGNGATVRTCGICIKNSQSAYLERVRAGLHIPSHTRKEICRNGHPQTDEITLQTNRGEWVCLTCRRASQAKYNAKRTRSA